MGNLLLALLVSYVALASFGASFSNAALPFLAQFPEDIAKGGSANQLRGPRAADTDPKTDFVYIADSGFGNRISVFTPWGGFVKNFGWDVAPAGVNEQQELRFFGPLQAVQAELRRGCDF